MSNSEEKPPQRRGVTPMLVVHNGRAALDYYRNTLQAEVTELYEDGEKVGHANVCAFGQTFMLADEYPDHQALSPQSVGGTPVTLFLEVDDVDAVAATMQEGGAIVFRGPENTGLGMRVCKLSDPFGHYWFLAGPLKG